MEMYNTQVKERFINSYDNEGTQKTIKALFLKTALTEETLGKDLYNFSIEDISDAFPDLSPKFASTASSYGRFLKIYISWSIKNGYRDNNENPLNGIEPSWFRKFVISSTKIHFNKDEFFNDLIEHLDNAQDQAMLALIWYGILGEKFTELSHMQYKHIHWNENKVDVYDDKGCNRTVNLPDNVMRYLEQAYKQSTYLTMKGNGEYKESELLRSADYIFRNVKSARAIEGEPLNYNVFYTRLKAIREAYDVSYLTPNSVRQSNLLYEAVQLINRDGEFGLKQRTELGDKFNLPTVTNNLGKEYYNPAMLSFINPDNIKMLYNIDVKM